MEKWIWKIQIFYKIEIIREKKSHFLLLDWYNHYVVYRMNLKALFSIATFMAQFVIISKGYKILTAVSDCCQETLSNNLNNLEGRGSVQREEVYYNILSQKLDRERKLWLDTSVTEEKSITEIIESKVEIA